MAYFCIEKTEKIMPSANQSLLGKSSVEYNI